MLAFDAVHKSFYDPGRGEVRAVDAVTLSLEPGVVALVGANGAGKSTLLRLAATLLVPDKGHVRVGGHDTVHEGPVVRANLGYLSTTTRLYQRLTAREQLAYAGGFHGLQGELLAAAIAREAERFGLAPFLDQRVEGLSTGQLQRLNLARVLLHRPRLLILDEPTTGLDLLAARQVVAAVAEARDPGRLILLATHLMPEVERLAERVVVMRDGAIVHDGPPAGLGRGEAFANAILGLVSGEA